MIEGMLPKGTDLGKFENGTYVAEPAKNINEYPELEYVPISALQQVTWERNVAISQLKSIGKGLGEKMDDVAKVKHGHWIIKKTAIGKEYTVCSECNTDFAFRTDKGTIAKMDMRGSYYCPNCGAKMDRLIDADELFPDTEWDSREDGYISFSQMQINNTPTVDAVPMCAYEQVAWERDVALMQLKVINKGLGEKMDDVAKVVRCKECRFNCANIPDWQDGININENYNACELTELYDSVNPDDFCNYGKRVENATD